MNTPARRASAPASTHGRRPLAFRTAAGQVVTPVSGERVDLDDICRMADLVFVCDTTGSMYGKLAGLLRCTEDFVGDLNDLGIDWRFSMVPFGDLTVFGDKVVGDLPFVDSVADANHMILQAPRFDGGCNDGESSLEAMAAAMDKPYRQAAVKVIVLLTDEPPLLEELTTQMICSRLHQGEYICFVASPAKCGFEPLARENGGNWYVIGPKLDTADLLAFLRRLLKQVSQVSSDVHRLGGGSVGRYLKSPERKILT